jgi:hypothetical protein
MVVEEEEERAEEPTTIGGRLWARVRGLGMPM